MENLPFTTTDIVVLAGIGLFGILGAFWGFVGLVTGIGAWIGTMVVTILGYPHAQAFARQHIQQELFADIAAGAGLFAGTLVLLMILSSVLSHVTKESPLGSINRALGFVAGVGTGYLLCCGILLASVLIFEEKALPDTVRTSRSYELVRVGGVTILETLPPDIGGYILDKLEKGRQTVNTAEEVQKLMQPPVTPSGTSGADNGSGDGSGGTGYSPSANDSLQRVIDNSNNQ